MPRVYKPNPLGKKYKKYSNEVIKQAVQEYNEGVGSLVEIAKKFEINRSVLYRHSMRSMKTPGGQTVLSKEAEEAVVKFINLCAQWGYPLALYELRLLVKKYLDQLGVTVKRFKDNMPGPDFAASFLHRHRNEISQDVLIKRKRTKILDADYENIEINPSKFKTYFYKENTDMEAMTQIFLDLLNGIPEGINAREVKPKKEYIDIQDEGLVEYLEEDLEEIPEIVFISVPEERSKNKVVQKKNATKKSKYVQSDGTPSNKLSKAIAKCLSELNNNNIKSIYIVVT